MIDVKTRNAIRAAIRRMWHKHPFRINALKRVEVREFELNKDGTPSKKVKVYYPCAKCGAKTKQVGTPLYSKLAVDHVNPVIPVDDPDIDLISYCERLFIEDPLEVLCEPCHLQKSLTENALRREHKARIKLNAS
jgi:5-methylcytosine-specific restriction endonuclease McrA